VNAEPPPADLPVPTSLDAEPEHMRAAIDTLLAHLDRSVHQRVRSIPPPAPGAARLAVLFSGGIDCTVLAYLAHQCVRPSVLLPRGARRCDTGICRRASRSTS
jgi:asparagine synthetase B (glutamine-hydrolysing)